MKMRVAEYVAQYLESLGCRAVFLLSGGGMMHLLDAVSRREQLKYYCNHHEQASAMAAESYARLTGRLGVCYATSGPGGSNTLTGVVGAWLDSSPVLFISGQSKASQTIEGAGLPELRQFGTFEVNIIPMVRSVTKYAAFVDKPQSIRYHLERACHTSLQGRPGPCFLDIPVDIQGALIEPESLEGFTPAENVASVSSSQINDVVAKLQIAKRPVIIAGHGVRCAGAIEPFRSVIRRLQVPVVTTPFAVDLMTHEDPLFIGHPGMKGDRAGNFAVQTADLLLTLGTSLHVTTTGYELDRFATGAFKIQVEPDQAVLDRERVKVDMKIRADTREFLDALSSRLDAGHFESVACRAESSWNATCRRWKQTHAVFDEPHARVAEQPHYYDIVRALGEVSRESTVFTTDAGSAFYVVGQALRTREGSRVISSGGLGSMGFALPAATGAAVARPEACVVCITGDGSLQTNIHELAVIKHHQLNIKILIVNNDGYVSIRNTQTSFFEGHLAGTSRDSGVSFPSLEKIAAAYDIPYASITHRRDLNSTLQAAIDKKGCIIVEIFTPSKQQILPTVSSERLEDGSMRSKPLHEMYPFMSSDQLRDAMEGLHA